MGTEFLNTTRPTAKKHLDRRRAELCAPDLFNMPTEDLGRSFLAKTDGSGDITTGDRIVIEAAGAGFLVRRGRNVVGRSDRCQSSLAKTLATAGGAFPAAISNVNPISATFEFCITPLSGKTG